MVDLLLRPPRASSPASARRRPVRVLLSCCCAMFLALAMLLGAGGAASAHDELTGTDPADGAAVEVLPPSLELSFSNVPSGIGAQIQVLDESGEDWAEGPVEIVDRTATQSLRAGAPAGDYTVSWRVVSSDSHPIEGVFSFTAQQGSTAALDSISTPEPVDVQEDPAEVTPTAGVSDFPWSIVLMIAALVVIVGVLAFSARRRLRNR
ncbi:copper resistance CopC family protein [Arthrobacter echini]|nr:copper resistance CopC family protein [Arthrobacter echini]